MSEDRKQLDHSADFILIGYLIDVPPMVSMVVNPIFERVGDNEKRTYTQIIGDGDIISGFRPVQIDRVADLIEHSGESQRVTIGQEAIYAYHFPEIGVTVGNKKLIDKVISAAIDLISQNKHSLHQALKFLGRHADAQKIFEDTQEPKETPANEQDIEPDRSQRFASIERSMRRNIAELGIGNSDVKIEDFDFSELTSDLTNSITDALYREFLPPLKNIYEENIEDGRDANFKNSLDVEDIVKAIKSELQEHVKERVLISARTKIKSDLEEQYFPYAGSPEEAVVSRVSNARKLLIPAFYASTFAMLSLVALSILSAVDLTFSVGQAFYDAVTDCTFGACSLDTGVIILKILSFSQIILICVLLLIVVIGSYQNSISKIGRRWDLPNWFSSSSLFDVIYSVIFVAIGISAIDVLAIALEEPDQSNTNSLGLATSTTNSLLVHVGLVLSALATAFCRRLQTSLSNKSSDPQSTTVVSNRNSQS